MLRTLSCFSLTICFALAATQGRAQSTPDSARAQRAVMQVDEEFRLAKIHKDAGALDRILSPQFFETNQNNNSRNKAQIKELFRSFEIQSLTTDESQVRIVSNTAFVTGSQTEDGDHMLFMRGYVMAGDRWQLLSSLQFHSPVSSAPADASEAVMRIDEAYRLAKLHQDIKALDRVLADGFYEANQNGNTRNKAESLDLWKSFSISSLTTDSHRVQVIGDNAVVTGTQTENGDDRMIFTRIYVNGPAGWQLISSTQFHNPNSDRGTDSVPR